MTDGDIYNSVLDIIQSVFKSQTLQLTAATSAKDVLGWDSFKTVEILIAVEDRFGITIRAREIERINNVGDLVRVVAGHSRR